MSVRDSGEAVSVSMWINNSTQQVSGQNSIILQFTDKNGATGKTFMYRGANDKYIVFMKECLPRMM